MSTCLPCQEAALAGLGETSKAPIPEGIQRYHAGVASPLVRAGIYAFAAAVIGLAGYAFVYGYRRAKKERR